MRTSEQMQKMKTQPGFVAALDQSGGSTAQALRLNGIKAQAWKDVPLEVRPIEGAGLWAIGYDDMERAEQVRAEVARLGWEGGRVETYYILLDLAVVVRHLDGSFTLDHRPFPGVATILGCTGVGLLAGLVLAAPLAGAAIGAVLGIAGTAAAKQMGISAEFIRDVETLMKPGTSALFVLDYGGDLEVILHSIQGLGGTVLKTNVDLERARLVQSTLAASAGENDQISRS
jgi:uncharacterized membrane protein